MLATRRTRAERLSALAGVLGPAVFIAGWAGTGSLTPGYSAVHDAISQLARLGAPHRPLMTAAFVGFGVSLPTFAPVLARALGAGKPLRISATVAGLATLGVAAFPLSRAGGGTEDALHAGWATLGYVAMALSPVLGAVALQRGRRRGLAALSLLTGVVSGAALCATSFTDSPGLLQRSGLGVVDLWFMTVATAILLGHEVTGESSV